MNKYEFLARISAVYDRVKTFRDWARAECERETLEQYNADGANRTRDLKVEGVKVGTLSVKSERAQFVVTDPAAYRQYLRDTGRMRVVRTIDPDRLDVDEIAAKYPEAIKETEEADAPQFLYIRGNVIDEEGEMVPGVKYVPEHANGVMIRGCKWDDVAPLLGPVDVGDMLLAYPASMLEEGEANGSD